MTHRSLILPALAFLLATSQSLSAQKKPIPPYSTRVQLDLSTDSATEPVIRSYLTRELRTLPGVQIVDEKPYWRISLVVVPTETVGGIKTGYAISTVVLEKFREDLLDNLVPDDAKRVTQLMLSDKYSFEAHKLAVIPLERLRDKCAEIVAQFDSERLEPERALWQKLRDASEKKN